MAPHVLSAAMSSAGADRQRHAPLWKAYSERTSALIQELTLRDIRLVLQGYADASVRDQGVFQTLAQALPRSKQREITPRMLCSISVAFAKLHVSHEAAFEWISKRAIEKIEAMDALDLGSLVNAFSRCSYCDASLLSHVAVCFKQHIRGTPANVSPAAATLVLNGFAVCSQSDSELWEMVLDSIVLPRLAEFSITQAALVMNSIA